MEKMELVELIVNRMLQVQMVSNHKQTIIDSISELFQFNPDLKWALKEYREKRAEWLKQNWGNVHITDEKELIYQAFKLEKEERWEHPFPSMCFKCLYKSCPSTKNSWHCKDFKPEEEKTTIPKEITLQDCGLDIMNTINDCVKAIREIRGKLNNE